MPSAAFDADELLRRTSGIRMTHAARSVVIQIQNGPPVRDYWSEEDPVWGGVHAIREQKPERKAPIPVDTGHWLTRTIEHITQGCNSALAPVNPATRAIALYCLAHIALWVHDYYKWCKDTKRPEAEHDLERNLEPFSNFHDGTRTCFRVIIKKINQIAKPIMSSRGDLEVIAQDIWHFDSILPTIHLVGFSCREYFDSDDDDLKAISRLVELLLCQTDFLDMKQSDIDLPTSGVSEG